MHALFSPDGTLHLDTATIRISDSFPAFDDLSIRPARVEVATDSKSVRYELPGKRALILTLVSVEDRIELRARLEGAASAPGWLFPVHSGLVTGAARFFRTGLGFSGPTNQVALTPGEEPFSFESYLMSALVAGTGEALVIYTTDNKSYTSKTQVHNRVYRGEFRNRKLLRDRVFIEAGFPTEAVPVPPDGLPLPVLHCISAPSLAAGLDRAARHIAAENRARVPVSSPVYYCSWYYNETRFSASDLERALDAADRTRAGFDSIQIDDGYTPAWGDWLEHNERWPDGMETAARSILDHGHRAGIWVAPMAAEEGSRIWREHPDWLLRDRAGNPIVKMAANAVAGLPHGNRYGLDLSHPEVRAYLRHVFSTLRRWGYTVFKTDFMDWGFPEADGVLRHTPGKTSAMWFDEALRIIREAIGPDSYWLACISYFAPFVGYCDGMRIASDVGIRWNGPGGNGNDGVGGGIMNMLQESYHDQFFNGILWANDPDVIFLRTEQTELSEPEVRSLALWSGMLGGTITISDFFDELPPDRLALWQFIHPGKRPLNPARLPFFNDPAQTLYVAVCACSQPEGHAVLILNPLDTEQGGTFAMRDLTGTDSAPAVPWNPGAAPSAPVELREISVLLPPHASALYWIGNSPPPGGL